MMIQDSFRRFSLIKAYDYGIYLAFFMLQTFFLLHHDFWLLLIGLIALVSVPLTGYRLFQKDPRSFRFRTILSLLGTSFFTGCILLAGYQQFHWLIAMDGLVMIATLAIYLRDYGTPEKRNGLR